MDRQFHHRPDVPGPLLHPEAGHLAEEEAKQKLAENRIKERKGLDVEKECPQCGTPGYHRGTACPNCDHLED